jgi:hypothetical protein
VLLFTLSGTEMISVPSKLPRLPKAICTTFDMISHPSPVFFFLKNQEEPGAPTAENKITQKNRSTE